MRLFNKALQDSLHEPEKLTVLDSQLVFGNCGIQPQFGEFNKELPTETVQGMCQLCATTKSAANAADSMNLLEPAGGEIPQEILQLAGYALPGQLGLADEFLTVLGKAVKVRVESQSMWCDVCMKQAIASGRFKVCNASQETTNIAECDDTGKSKADNGTLSGRAQESGSNSTPCEMGCQERVDAQANMPIDTACGHARVAVLFSGGIDSLVIAALADR